jgi:hypothetical protein
VTASVRADTGGYQMRSYEPAEFASRLASNVLEEPVGLALHGLVKADENDSHVLLFSTSLSCETWIPIPVSLISSIRHIRNVRCKDHQHPLSPTKRISRRFSSCGSSLKRRPQRYELRSAEDGVSKRARVTAKSLNSMMFRMLAVRRGATVPALGIVR